MKIVIAPDSFKGSLTALEVAQAIQEGVRRVIPDAQVDRIPMADGGEGTVQSLVDATDGEIVYEWVTDPLGNKVRAAFGVLGDGKTGVIATPAHKLNGWERIAHIMRAVRDLALVFEPAVDLVVIEGYSIGSNTGRIFEKVSKPSRP